MPTAAQLADERALSPAEYLEMPRFSGADRERGRRLFRSCGACHSIDPAGQHRIGPSLYGIFGREAGKVAGYEFSDSLREAGFVWTPRALDAWLAQPERFLPGNRMSFVGLGDEEDRTDLIGYLLARSAGD